MKQLFFANIVGSDVVQPRNWLFSLCFIACVRQFKSGLYVKVINSKSVVVATSPVTAPDGFYFATVPAGGPYTVQLFNPVGQIPGKSITIPSIANNQYQAVDFLNLNPADPAITGFVFDSSFHGISGV